MVSNEIYSSDVVYMGGRIISTDDFRNKFPDWYETWNLYSREDNDKYILISDYDYGISATMNVFYRVHFNKAEADLVCELEGTKYGGAYHPPIRLADRLIFAPCKSKNWAIFDLKTEQWTYVDVPKNLCGRDDEVFFRSWKSIGDSLIYLPGEQGVFAKLDYKSGEITYHDCFKQRIPDGRSKQAVGTVTTYKKSVLIAMDMGDELYEIDAESMEIVAVHKISHGIRGIKSMLAIPKTDWLFFIEKSDNLDQEVGCAVYKWNISTGELLKIDSLPIHPCGEDKGNLLAGFLYYKGELYVTPQQGDCLVRINVENNSTERIEIDMGHNPLERKHPFYKRWGDNMVFPLFTYNGFVNTFTVTLPYDFSIAELDFANKKMFNRRKWKINGIEKLLKQNLADQIAGNYYENDFYSLEDFIGDLI